MFRRFLICASVAALAGCAGPARNDFESVQQSVQSRGGYRVEWNQSSEADAKADLAVADLLSRPLSRESAVQIALLNNPNLQATFEDIGVAQADLVQAGLLKNPVFDIDFKFLQGGGKPHVEAAVSEDFLSILQLPLKKKIAEGNLLATQLRVTNEVIALESKTERAYIDLQAAQQELELRQSVEQAADASAEAAKQLRDAGNFNELRLANERAQYEQAKLDSAAARAQMELSRVRLDELMGLASSPGWTIAERLPDVPPADPGEVELQQTALANRTDLAALRAEAEVAARRLGIAKLSWANDAKIGAVAERDHGGSWQGGPSVSVPIPLFDIGTAARARAAAELRRAQQMHAAKLVEIRSAVRADLARMTAARARVHAYQTALLPLRRRIVEQSQRQYNGMFIGVFELLQARQAEIDAGRMYIEALKDYSLARADLKQTIGGALPPGTPPAAVPATQPATRPAEKSDDSMKNMKM